MMAISFAVKPNFTSTNKLKSDSKDASPKVAIKMTINGITYKGFINFLICSFLLSFSFDFNDLLIVRFGSFKKNIEMNAKKNFQKEINNIKKTAREE